jgi:hypothetical protein
MRALQFHFVQTTRAGDGARTRDIKLGRLALYQLSYSRNARRFLLFDLHCTHQIVFQTSCESRSAMVGEGFEPSKA